mgnify:CR=1 FL=1
MGKMGLVIKATEDGSIAQKLDFEAGDILVLINNVFIADIIDYLYNCAGNEIEVMIKKTDGKLHRYKIHKRYDKTLGILFEDTITTSPRRCRNHCTFCFVDQMAKGLRKSLYVKDDDYRLSFLDGNYVTLTNITEDDLNRIIKWHLSPLYISVHATDNEVRDYLLGRKKADNDIMRIISNLVENNIKIHCQIVLCPGVNDGEVLEKTLYDLGSFYPNVISCAVVPVGLTKFRDGLKAIETFNEDTAAEALDLIFRWNRKFNDKFGSNFVYPSDEFFVLSKKSLPDADYYEGYPQIENGVGMLRKFTDETYAVSPGKIILKNKICILTSQAAYRTLNTIINRYFYRDDRLALTVIKNNFWGGNINIAGLITADDIITQVKCLEGFKDFDYVLIPANMLKRDEDVFLDGITLSRVQEEIDKKIIKCNVNGEDFINTIMEVGMGNYE